MPHTIVFSPRPSQRQPDDTLRNKLPSMSEGIPTLAPDLMQISACQHMWAWKGHDVVGDGHCFYRCVAKCLLSDPETARDLGLGGLDEMSAVVVLRYGVRQALRKDRKVQLWLADLLLLILEAPDVVEEYPCLHVSGGASIGDRIWKSNVWASALEVDIVRESLRPWGIDLLIASDASKASLMDGTKVEEEIHAALRGRDGGRRNIVLIRLTDSEHYMYCSLDSRCLIRTADLKDCMASYVEDDE